jgi:aspartate aminotransferase-like enzyme
MTMEASLPSGRFFLPGPTEVHPDVLAAQTRPMIGHRGSAIRELIGGVQGGLKDVFRTARPVVISTSSATGLMEAAIRNGVGGGRILALVNGAFSERFAEIAEECGKAVVRWEVPHGAVHSADQLAERLSDEGFEAVTVTHSETSTGALQDLEAIASVVGAHPGTLLLVDAVTGVGGVETHTDAWGVDFILTGSQKALALPPGLAFAVASEAMLERARGIPGRGWYFDLVRLSEDLEIHQTPATPAISLLYALETQLGRIAEEGMETRWKRHVAMMERTASWAGELGIELLAAEGERSPTVSCLQAPDPAGLVRRVRERGWVIGGGYGQLRETTFRIGHMGDHTLDELDDLLEVIHDALR